MKRVIPVAGAAALAMLGCHVPRTGMDQPRRPQLPRAESRLAPDIQVPWGFRAVRVIQGLDFPSAMTWDAAGNLYVLESGAFPVPLVKRRIVRVVGAHVEEVVLEGSDQPTGAIASGLTFHDGWLYLSHEEKDGTFGISRVRPAGGAVEAVLRGLPAQGDHDVSHLAFDAQGNLYFGVGSATNSGVVSSADPVNAKWLSRHPTGRDIPCRDLVLTGQSFTDDNAMTPAKGDKATTGAYQAYGTAGATAVAAERLCTGAIYALNAGAREPELVAWGFRNPVGLALDLQGVLHAAVRGAGSRGSRPVRDDPDAIYRVRAGHWYGWPDYSAELVPLADPRYQPPPRAQGHRRLEPLLDHARSGLYPPSPQVLVAATAPGAAIGGITFLPADGPFARWGGQLLVSEMGNSGPATDLAGANGRAGFQVEIVNPETGTIGTFTRNRGTGAPQPASSLSVEDALEHPVDVKVGPDGLVYVLDFGVVRSTADADNVMPRTGKVFRIEPVPAPAPSPSPGS